MAEATAEMNPQVVRSIGGSRFTPHLSVATRLMNMSFVAGLLFVAATQAQVFPSPDVFTLLVLLACATALTFLPKIVVLRNRARSRSAETAGASSHRVRSEGVSKRAPAESELGHAIRRCRLAFIGIGVFSGLINILMLTAPLFMLQIYDRVLPSRSVPSLVGLAILAGGLFAFQGLLDAIRARVLLRIGSSINDDLSARVYEAIVCLPLKARSRGDGLQPIRDLDQIRSFMGGAGPGALFDLPWMPLYVAICYLFHPLIGIAAFTGATLLVILTLVTELATHKPAKATAAFAGERNALLEASRRNAEVMQAMGMGPQLAARFEEVNGHFLRSHARASDRAGTLGALSRVMRLVLQSVVLGLGAYLVINDEATAGVIIASAILVSRALAPVELAIGNWKGFVAARQARKRLGELLNFLPGHKQLLLLPKPCDSLGVEMAGASPPGDTRIVLQDVSFALKSGDGLGIIGPSASGKSSLARLMVGVWQPARGKIRLDGAALDQWAPKVLGQHLGYLPQNVELFDGTIAENISRFEVAPDPEKVIAAAKAASVHQLVVSLPQGYDTRIGEAGESLSAGQRQRIALARALFGNPFLVVLDEPNSNLDSEGEEALTSAISGVRARGGIAVVIAHRASALAAVDQILVLNKGQQQAFGPKDDVLRAVTRPTVPPLAIVPKTGVAAS